MKIEIRIKRIYELAAENGGKRFLIGPLEISSRRILTIASVQ